MFTQEEEKNLREHLSLAPHPDICLTFQELSGFIFGLAMTPVDIPFSEYIRIILGDFPSPETSADGFHETQSTFQRILKRLRKRFNQDRLKFPFHLEQITTEEITSIFEWTSGFEEALALREEIWDPEEYHNLPERRNEELLYAMIGIQGIVEPEDILHYFRDIPEFIIEESYPGIKSDTINREIKIQLYLLTSLPLAIITLQKHAHYIRLKQRTTSKNKISPLFPKQDRKRNKGISTKSEQKKTIDGKSKIIHVDFNPPPKT